MLPRIRSCEGREELSHETTLATTEAEILNWFWRGWLAALLPLNESRGSFQCNGSFYLAVCYQLCLQNKIETLAKTSQMLLKQLWWNMQCAGKLCGAALWQNVCCFFFCYLLHEFLERNNLLLCNSIGTKALAYRTDKCHKIILLVLF